MTHMRTAWRRAVTTVEPPPAGPGLAELLAVLGPAGATSAWTCEDVEATGPLADDLMCEAAVGPIPGPRLAELAVGIEEVRSGRFQGARPDDRAWVMVRVDEGGPLAVATRNRALLDDLRRRFPEE